MTGRPEGLHDTWFPFVAFSFYDHRVDATNGRPAVDSASVLEAAREELIQEAERGAAGRDAVERYADRVDTLLQRLFFEAPPPAQPVADPRPRRVRTPAPHAPFRRRRPRAVRAADRRRGRAIPARVSAPALGSAARRRPPGPRARRLRAARNRQSGVSARAARRAARRRRSGAVRQIPGRVPPARDARGDSRACCSS